MIGQDFIHFVTDVRPGEHDFLSPVKHLPLVIKDLDDRPIRSRDASPEGWTTGVLCDAATPLHAPSGANAYLGDVWVGSTEI